jgi:hypothetical protein
MRAGFERDERGSAIEKFAIAGGLLALASLFLGSTLEQMAETGGLPTIALLASDQYVATRPKSSGFDAIDYTATGSINGRVVLDPCTGRQTTP